MKFFTRMVCLGALALSAGCGDDETDDGPPPPAPPSFGYTFDSADACNASVPLPNDLFTGDDLLNERADCGGPDDSVEAAIYQVIQHEGSPIDAEISIPVVNATLDISSVVSQTEFSLTSSASTSSTSDALPPLVLIGRPSSSTSADDWFQVEYDALVEIDKLVVTPRENLQPATLYVLVATDTIQTSENKAIEASPYTQLLLQDGAITASGDLSAASATKLERERTRLADAKMALANAYPPVTSDRIRSIHGWRTSLGPEKLNAIVEQYKNALSQGRFTFKVTTEGGDLAPSSILAQGGPVDNLKNFRKGTISVPKILDDNGRIRAGWANSDVQTTELPFLISVPDTARTKYPVTVYLPGYGRSKLDASLLANEFGGGSQSAVLGLDLPFYGDRSLDMTDNEPNNENPTVNGADGIPDSSGVGIYSGAPGVLRDGMISTIIEVVHVLETLKQEDAFQAEMITPDGSPSKIHLVGHGQSAAMALHAGLISPVGTIQTPSGGSDLEKMLLEGPAAARAHFLQDAPNGVNETNIASYIEKLKNSVLNGLSVTDAGSRINERYIMRSSPKILLSHASDAEFVPASARTALIDAISLPSRRVSQHGGTYCDDFFLYTCVLGENSAIVSRAQEQLATFVSSGGVTVKAPALR